jgi:hypothetical protein
VSEGNVGISSRFYDVFTIRDGMIRRLDEHTSREEAARAGEEA